MKADIRREQLALLRFEKHVAALAVLLAQGAEAARSADEKLSFHKGEEAVEEMRGMLARFAEEISRTHDAFYQRACDLDVHMLKASGGVPKEDMQEVVASILMLG